MPIVAKRKLSLGARVKRALAAAKRPPPKWMARRPTILGPRDETMCQCCTQRPAQIIEARRWNMVGQYWEEPRTLYCSQCHCDLCEACCLSIGYPHSFWSIHEFDDEAAPICVDCRDRIQREEHQRDSKERRHKRQRRVERLVKRTLKR
jgi:hypothetical protein